MTYTNFTDNEFYVATGDQVSKSFPDPKKKEIAIAAACQDVMDYIESSDPNFDKTDITIVQNGIINRAAILQLQYSIANGDFKLLSGFSAITAEMIPQAEIVKRILCPESKRILDRRIICRVF